jgi:hypothetical protein
LSLSTIPIGVLARPFDAEMVGRRGKRGCRSCSSSSFFRLVGRGGNVEGSYSGARTTRLLAVLAVDFTDAMLSWLARLPNAFVLAVLVRLKAFRLGCADGRRGGKIGVAEPFSDGGLGGRAGFTSLSEVRRGGKAGLTLPASEPPISELAYVLSGREGSAGRREFSPFALVGRGG